MFSPPGRPEWGWEPGKMNGPSGPPGWGCVWGDRFPCSQPRPGLNFPEGDGGRESDPQENWDLVIKPNCKFS